MKMGLGIWKFTTTLVLLFVFVVAFVNKVEGKRMNLLDFPQFPFNHTVTPESKLYDAFFDCSKIWEASVGQKCLHLDDILIEYCDQLHSPNLDEVYLAVMKAAQVICRAEDDLNCTLGFCTCYNSSGSCTRHTQNLKKDCKKEYRAIWPFVRKNGTNTVTQSNCTTSSVVFCPRPQFEYQYMLWTSLLFIVVGNLG